MSSQWQMKKMPSSYISFCEAMNIDNYNTALLNHCTAQHLPNSKNRLNDLVMISIANKTPIAQFIVDIYGQCKMEYKTIDEFMQKSTFLSMLPKDSKSWRLIRKHLSEYLKHIYKPIDRNMFIDHQEQQHDDEDDDDHDNDHYGDVGDDTKIDPIAVKHHNMAGILYYCQIIHNNIYILNKICQIDVIFVPQSLKWINDEYFDELGVKYEKITHQKDQNIKEMMRHFNEKLDDTKFKRCIILIMENNDVCQDAVYIFEPLQNNALPPEIYNYTEMPWICNSKSDILPGFAVKENNCLCLSLHRHNNNNDGESYTERVYFSYGTYGVGVFKHNLIDIISPFCVSNQSDHPMVDWDDEINNKEFKDHQYNVFVNTYFADLKLIKPDIKHYLMERSYVENRWSKSLYKCWANDKVSSLSLVQKYMYIPTTNEYYQHINTAIGEHYKSMGFEYNNKFLTYIYDNELEDCSLNDNLGLNCDVDDCVLLDFDEMFPMIQIDGITDRDKFIFRLLQNIYVYGSNLEFGAHLVII